MSLLPGVDAYVFDLFGTLFDYDSLSQRYARAKPSGPEFVRAWRTKQLTLAMAATLMERYQDFDAITGAAFAYVAQTAGIAFDAAARAEAVTAWAMLPPHADVPPMLSALHAAGIRTAILSNGSPASLASTLAHAGLTEKFGAVISVDDVRAFKPARSVYALAGERLGLAPDRIAFVSSNGWDATGAAEFGFRVIWCNRSGAPPEPMGLPPEREIRSMHELLAGSPA